jgi:hypothetical protein
MDRLAGQVNLADFTLKPEIFSHLHVGKNEPFGFDLTRHPFLF